MNQTIKRALCLMLTLALALSFAACANQETAEPPADAGDAAEPDTEQVVATVGSYEIKRGDLMDTFNSIAQSYQYFGQAAPTDDAGVEQMQDAAMEELVSSKMMYYQAEKLGLYPLTEEQVQQVAEETKKNVDELISSFESYAQEEGAEDISARAVEMMNEALSANGWSLDFEGYKEWLSEYNTTVKLTELVKEQVEKDVSLTEEDYRAYYDEQVAAQKEKYESAPADYLTDAENFEMFGGDPVLVIPEGFVRVKVLSLEPEGAADENYDPKLSEMAELEAEYGRLALENEAAGKARMREIEKSYKTLTDETRAMRDAFFKNVKAKADEAMQKLSEGVTFDEALKTYGDDDSYGTYQAVGEKGRLMALSGDDSWDDQLHAAVEALTDGAYSGIIETDGALYIVQRVGLEKAATLAYDEVKALVSAQAELEAKEAAWTEKQAEWMEDDSVITYFEDAYRDIGKQS